MTVAIYAGSSLPTSGFGSAFNFAEPAVLTQNWTQASVLLATAVTLGLLAAGSASPLAARRWRAVVPVFGACVAAVSLVAVAQMTSQVSRAATAAAQAVNVPVSAERGAAGRAGRRRLRRRLAGLGAAGVPGFLDGARGLQPGRPAARPA